VGLIDVLDKTVWKSYNIENYSLLHIVCSALLSYIEELFRCKTLKFIVKILKNDIQKLTAYWVFKYLVSFIYLFIHLFIHSFRELILHSSKMTYSKVFPARVQIPGGYRAIAPPRICQEGLNITQAPKKMMK